MPTAAQLSAAAIARAGVDAVFGLPGIHNIAFWPALAGEGVRVVGSRHEQGTAYAADSYARATGRVGIALTTTGPGAANTLGAVGEAWASRSPIVVLASDIPSTGRRPNAYRGYLHECVDQAAMFAPVTKATIIVEKPEDFAECVTRAIELALTPPTRPVYLQFPTDFLGAEVEGQARDPQIGVPAAPERRKLDAAAELLAGAERPIIWAGGGCRDAGDELASFATRLGAPVVTTWQARGLLAADHPLLVPLPPHEPATIELIERADVVVVVGSDLDASTTQEFRIPLPRRRIVINLEPAAAVENYDATVIIEGDAGAAMAALTEKIGEHGAWAGDVQAIRGELIAEMASSGVLAEAAQFLGVVDDLIPQDAIVVADMAIPAYWMSAYSLVHRRHGLQFPMGWGTLGFGIPATVGAAAANVAPVVTFSGDGGALFAIGELAALAQEQLPATIVIFDDGGYGVLRHGHSFPKELAGTELKVPDFAAIAQGFGLEARSVEGVGEEFRAAFAEAIASGKPNLLVTKTSLAPPRTTSPRWPLKATVKPDAHREAERLDQLVAQS